MNQVIGRRLHGGDMDAIREIVSGNALSSIMKLPKWLHSRQVEVIVLPVVGETGGDSLVSTSKISRRELDALKKDSVAIRLTGAISHPPITMSEIREERLGARNGRTD
jgi:hypothetical protein